MRANEASRILGPLGAEVMEVLWAACGSESKSGPGPGPLTVRAVLDRLNRARAKAGADELAYTTVMTVLGRLTERGAARRTPAGRGYAYQPAVRDVAELAVRDVVREHGEAAVSYFVDAARTDPALTERLRRLLVAESDTPSDRGES